MSHPSFIFKQNRRRQIPITTMPLCKTEPHTTTHLFNCTKINTQLKVRICGRFPWSLLDKWRDPVSQRTWIPTRWRIPLAGVPRSVCQTHPPLSVEWWADNNKVELPLVELHQNKSTSQGHGFVDGCRAC